MADNNNNDSNGTNNANLALIRASNDANLDGVVDALAWGADVNHRNRSGNTALHLACHNKARDVAFALLRAGADWTLENKKGETAAQIKSGETFLLAFGMDSVSWLEQLRRVR